VVALEDAVAAAVSVRAAAGLAVAAPPLPERTLRCCGSYVHVHTTCAVMWRYQLLLFNRAGSTIAAAPPRPPRRRRSPTAPSAPAVPTSATCGPAAGA
jgi:hypothetical protein